MNTVGLSTLSLTVAIAVMTLGYANPSFADKPSGGEHDHGGGGVDGATFDVFILGGGLDGRSGIDNPWLENFGGKNSIGLNDAAPAGLDVGMLMGLADFTGEDEDSGCFPADTGTDHASTSLFPLHQAIVKQGRNGRAEASFWFHGATTEGDEVLYVLKLFGHFDGENVEFPGDAVLLMDEWELKVENEGRKIKNMSCESQGMGKDVTISVFELP
ncbi:MAG: hypothetical protein V3S53_07365 [Gammaproteobacteria bacterium]